MTEASKESTPVINLTDRYLKALKPAPQGQRNEIRDGVQPGLRVRVTENGAVTFCLAARFPGGEHFTRKALGSYPKMTLADAREKARKWLLLIGEGKDPVAEAAAEAERVRAAVESKRAEELKKQKHSFAHVAERYIDEITPLQRQGKRVAVDIRNQFIKRWGSRPVVEIERADVVALLTQKRKQRSTAGNLFVAAKGIFSWAIETGEFGLQHAPTDHIKIKRLIGARKPPRKRVLTDEELAAFWKSAKAMPYPYGPAYQFLALTGLRLNEAAMASWAEIDLKKRTFLIPASRMKGTDEKASEHLVPLTDAMIKVLDDLPTFEDGDFVFTTSKGKKPFILGDKQKKKVDALMVEELREAARARGEDPAKVKLTPWVNHDLRRTCRSTLSKLKVPTVVGEAVLAHRQGGIAGTYDRHSYADEKRDALERWNNYLIGLCPEPEPENVVKLRRRA